VLPVKRENLPVFKLLLSTSNFFREEHHEDGMLSFALLGSSSDRYEGVI
jgi:hypothetical protein